MQVGGVGAPEFHPGVVEEPAGRERDTIFNNIQSISAEGCHRQLDRR